MFARSSLRLWAPNYFRGQSAAARRTGARTTRSYAVAGATAAATAKPSVARRQKSLTRQKAPQWGTYASPASRAGAPVHPSASSLTSPSTTSSHAVEVDPAVQQAQELLTQLTRSSSSSSSSATKDAVQSFVSFTARRDIFGPLRHRLPPAPMLPTRAALRTSSQATMGGSNTVSAMPRLRAIPSPRPSTGATSQGPVPPVSPTEQAPARPFTLAELTVFLQLYDAVEGDDGHVLAQLLADVHRRLADLAKARSSTGNESRCGHADTVVESPLPLPALLFTMSSLGVVEEAALDIVTSTVPITTASPARRGLLYRQLPTYSAEELVLLIIALHRFGHAMQPSMKAVVKALRAAQYNTAAPSGRFYRAAKTLKKRWQRTQSSTRSAEDRLFDEATAAAAAAAAAEATGVPEPLSGDAKNEQDGVVRAIQRDAELQALVVELRCPLFLLLEALTALSLTVHRRTDAVTFLADCIAVTAVMELTSVQQGKSAASSSALTGASQREGDRAYALLVAQQLLRAAKLTEEMEQPQPLLSEVFAWSCSVSSGGVVTDGGEAGEVASNRIAYYDHVTADLVKLNRTD